MTRIIVASIVMVLLTGCDGCATGGATGDVVSDIAPDETIVFFRTAGWLDEHGQQWHLPVHGWIYEPESSVARVRAFEKVLNEKFGLYVTEQARGRFSRRVNLLLADNERGKRIVVNIGGRIFHLPASGENGHFEKTIVISAAEAAHYAQDGLVHYSAVTAGTEARKFTGAVRLLKPDGLSVISDIDDTVKISRVGDRASLLDHTFLLEFVAAPGMAALYRDWSTEEVGFHFVSSSPWQLYTPIGEFLDRAGFPWATFSLKTVRFRDATLLDLFRKGTETKPPAIEAILNRYPDRQFVLVGDSGEQDPEVYAALLRQRPAQIVKIYIRNVTGERAGNERFTNLFDGIDGDRWQLFDEPGTLELPGNFDE